MVQTREEKLLSALPGTAYETAIRLGVSVQTVRKWIRCCLDAGTVEKRVQYLGHRKHTLVYYPVTGQ